MLIKLAVIKSIDNKVSEISLAKDVEESKSRLRDQYLKTHKQKLYEDDIIIETKEFRLEGEISSYMVKDPYGEESPISIALLPFSDKKTAQEFVSFVKEVSDYDYNDLEKAVSFINGKLMMLPEFSVYW